MPVRQLEVTGLTCVRAEREVFSDVTFSVKSGEAILLRGPNGAGKTSLLMCLASYLPIASGTLTWNGRDPEQRPGEDMHYVGHQSAIKPSLSVAENLAFWANINGGHPDLVPDVLLAARLDHAANLEAMLLSAGQLRRLALARLLVSPRPIWLLDEPTSALDAQGAAWVEQMIDKHLQNGGFVIAATHLDLALQNSPQIKTIMLRGAK